MPSPDRNAQQWQDSQTGTIYHGTDKDNIRMPGDITEKKAIKRTTGDTENVEVQW
jgi:hypothetical protein